MLDSIITVLAVLVLLPGEMYTQVTGDRRETTKATVADRDWEIARVRA